MPFLISCITGGTMDGSPLNILLAKLAQHARLAFGLGSMRVLFHEPKAYKDFSMRTFAPDIPLLANIGAAQLAEYGPARTMEAAHSLEADALVVHLNPGQEIAQTGGDVDFRRVLDAISALVDTGVMPVIVKETGYGIRPRRVRELLARGVQWVDLAGAGGADWLQVELACRHEDGLDAPAAAEVKSLSETFSSWGLPTALILAALRAGQCAHDDAVAAHLSLPKPEGEPRLPRGPGAHYIHTHTGGGLREALPLIASGGLKNGLDLAKSLALGASLGGMALPLLKAYAQRGEEGLYAFAERISRELRMAMFMTGSRTIAALRNAAFYYDADFDSEVRALLAAEALP
jgi:isopentenyl diphosphate isomerase/L-lactate dehydrogenase-like FMN-dependent dehydrogenase